MPCIVAKDIRVHDYLSLPLTVTSSGRFWISSWMELPQAFLSSTGARVLPRWCSIICVGLCVCVCVCTCVCARGGFLVYKVVANL